MKVLSLSEVDPGDLDAVFLEEIQCWQSELFWDYRPAVELITKYARSRSLPGHVVQNRDGKTVGYSYHLVDRPVGYIGNLYVRRSHAHRKPYEALLEQTMQSLWCWGHLERIECQVFGFNFDMAPLFKTRGFKALKRHFLALPLDGFNADLNQDSDLEFQTRPWDRRFFIQAAEVIYDSYSQSPDHALCRDYQTREGCIRFLRNLVDNPGCGIFTADSSYLGVNRNGELCALLVTSKIGLDTGMIPQISVRTDSQGKGIGTKLLYRYFQEAKQRGLKRVTLSVSDANQGAYRLYHRLGFRDVKDFYAFVWTQ